MGEWPSHPELLDYLAEDFRSHGWDLKRTIKSMVMSQTYRQSSLTSPPVREADPYNRWLARQSRFRLDAELVHNNALAMSGLLVNSIGHQREPLSAGRILGVSQLPNSRMAEQYGRRALWARSIHALAASIRVYWHSMLQVAITMASFEYALAVARAAERSKLRGSRKSFATKSATIWFNAQPSGL